MKGKRILRVTEGIDIVSGRRQKARRLLGFETRVSIDDGLRGLVVWWRQERQTANA